MSLNPEVLKNRKTFRKIRSSKVDKNYCTCLYVNPIIILAGRWIGGGKSRKCLIY